MSQETLNLLQYRAYIKSKIRACLERRGLLEADVPLLYPYVCPDDAIALLSFPWRYRHLYLQPSPELNLKKVVAQYHQDCYSLNYAYRDDPATSRHHIEFLMLEYYLIGADRYQACLDLTLDIVKIFLESQSREERSYVEVWQEKLKIPYRPEKDYFESLLKEFHIDFSPSWNQDTLEDLAFSTLIQPQLGQKQVDILNGFPQHLSALAKIDQKTQLARRYEIFVEGVEIANGYDELIDAQSNKERFEAWIKKRSELEKDCDQDGFKDERFFKSMAHCPPCAGVAIGIERLMKIALQVQHIEEVILIPWTQDFYQRS